MTRLFLHLLVVSVLFIVPLTEGQEIKFNANNKSTLTENIGQIKDQNGKFRDDIQFVMHGNGVNVFIGDNQLHYQFYREEFVQPPDYIAMLHNDRCAGSCKVHTYRMDVRLEHAKDGLVPIMMEPGQFYENYFLQQSPVSGTQAHTFGKLVFKDVYPSIDWVVKVAEDRLEEDFLVHPGGDVGMIKMRYDGQTSLKINNDGSITANSPMGSVTENAPVCYYEDGKKLNASFVVSGNEVSYRLEGALAANKGYIIDPVLEWGTYYGPDSNASPFLNITSDGVGHMYASGYTYAAFTGNICTFGSFDTINEGNSDAYLVKFDSSGNRLWATYYGGNQIDWGYSVICDRDHNVYMGGFTASDSLISTAGSHQDTLGAPGGWDGFLVKFNPSGTRLWATYYGGDQEDVIYSVICDNLNNIYIAGAATSSFNIATPGSFEDAFYNPGGQNIAGFFAKFDTGGVRQWGTYFVSYQDTGSVVFLADLYNTMACTDGEYIYVSGWTDGNDSLTTSGTWQSVYGGGPSDAILAKFNNSGNRLWATYYGGQGQDMTGSATCDKDGFVYLMGSTVSDSCIASVGSFQPLRSGGADIFLAKFNPANGMREWGTYYGGPGDETVGSTQIAHDYLGNVYITGYTNSNTGVASSGAWQAVYGGGAHDAFLALFTNNDSELWSTYYGGDSDDNAYACTFDNENIYICGFSNSNNAVA